MNYVELHRKYDLEVPNALQRGSGILNPASAWSRCPKGYRSAYVARFGTILQN